MEMEWRWEILRLLCVLQRKFSKYSPGLANWDQNQKDCFTIQEQFCSLSEDIFLLAMLLAHNIAIRKNKQAKHKLDS